MQTNKHFVLPIVAAFVFGVIISFIPPYQSPAQPIRTDSVSTKINRIESKIEVTENKVDSNTIKTQILLAFLSKPDTKPKVVTRTQIKKIIVRVPVEVPVCRDENIWLTEGQYVNRAIIIYQACRSYGGDSFRPYSYAEWKMQRGLLQNKSYRLYEKYLHEEAKQ
ncbi:hypothetical protein [Niabella aurantiaca]|uniref:hypothetical protein n=1 Tax=Niabella aurantiaca TaxID=379900 RepID=UPI0003828DA1|nr:hypothetical protein [Niabella aurantiaca]